MNRFTVEETNLLSIYHEGSKAQLIENMTAGGILILFLTKHQNITMKMLKVSRQVPYLMTII